MKAKFAYYCAAALLASGLLAAWAGTRAEATSTTPKLAPGHYLFFAAANTADLPPNCPIGQIGWFYFQFVYSPDENSTIRFTTPNGTVEGIGSASGEVVVVSVPKKTGSGPWDVTYTANTYDSSGTKLQSWSGIFTANGVPADTESIVLSLQLTNWPDPGDATTCSPTITASGAMTGSGS
jgi:hypothetical protein